MRVLSLKTHANRDWRLERNFLVIKRLVDLAYNSAWPPFAVAL